VICTWLSIFHTYMTTYQNYAGKKQRSYQIMIMKMFAPLDKAKTLTENTRGSNLAAVKYTTVQVSRLPNSESY
jgi:hypothetical protein